MAVHVQIVVVWVVRVCSIVGAYQRFGWTLCFHLQGILNPEEGSSVFLLSVCIHLQDTRCDLKMEAACSPETLESIYKTARRHNPEDHYKKDGYMSSNCKWIRCFARRSPKFKGLERSQKNTKRITKRKECRCGCRKHMVCIPPHEIHIKQWYAQERRRQRTQHSPHSVTVGAYTYIHKLHQMFLFSPLQTHHSFQLHAFPHPTYN
jgi:hypothetical protein